MKLFGSLTSITFSPIVTIEPRRRKFHCPIRLKIPLPPGYRQELSSNLRLLCSITGGQNRAIWEDVTGSTPLSVVQGCLLFTTTVSARFWLVHCQKQQHCADSTRYAQEIYRHLIAVPFMAKFVTFAKRRDINEANIRVFCMTDDKEERTLEVQEHYTQVAKSRDVEVLEGQMMYLEFGGNLVPTYLAPAGAAGLSRSNKLINEQLAFGFHAFQENRLAFAVQVKEIGQEPSGRLAFMEDSIKYLASLNSQQRAYLSERRRRAICTLGVTLPQMCVSYDDILGTPKRNSYLASARIGELSLADIASDLEISRPLDDDNYAARSPSPRPAREMDQDSLVGSGSGSGLGRPRLDDWLELAPKLGIPRDEVEFIQEYCRTSNPTGGLLSPALILLLHWYKLSSAETRDQDLARALVSIGRDDIAKKLNFAIEPKRISRSTMELLHEIEMIPVRSSENLYASRSELSTGYPSAGSRGTSLRRLNEAHQQQQQPSSSSSGRDRRRVSLERIPSSDDQQQQQQQRQRILRETATVQQQPDSQAMETRASSRVASISNSNGAPRIQVRQASLMTEQPSNTSSAAGPTTSAAAAAYNDKSQEQVSSRGGDGALERQFADSLIEQVFREALEIVGQQRQQQQQRENGFGAPIAEVEWTDTDGAGNMSIRVEHTTLIESMKTSEATGSGNSRKQRRRKVPTSRILMGEDSLDRVIEISDPSGTDDEPRPQSPDEENDDDDDIGEANTGVRLAPKIRTAAHAQFSRAPSGIASSVGAEAGPSALSGFRAARREESSEQGEPSPAADSSLAASHDLDTSALLDCGDSSLESRSSASECTTIVCAGGPSSLDACCEPSRLNVNGKESREQPTAKAIAQEQSQQQQQQQQQRDGETSEAVKVASGGSKGFVEEPTRGERVERDPADLDLGARREGSSWFGAECGPERGAQFRDVASNEDVSGSSNEAYESLSSSLSARFDLEESPATLIRTEEGGANSAARGNKEFNVQPTGSGCSLLLKQLKSKSVNGNNNNSEQSEISEPRRRRNTIQLTSEINSSSSEKNNTSSPTSSSTFIETKKRPTELLDNSSLEVRQLSENNYSTADHSSTSTASSYVTAACIETTATSSSATTNYEDANSWPATQQQTHRVTNTKTTATATPTSTSISSDDEDETLSEMVANFCPHLERAPIHTHHPGDRPDSRQSTETTITPNMNEDEQQIGDHSSSAMDTTTTNSTRQDQEVAASPKRTTSSSQSPTPSASQKATLTGCSPVAAALDEAGSPTTLGDSELDVDDERLKRILACKRLSEGCLNRLHAAHFIQRKNSLHMIEELPALTEGEPMRHTMSHSGQQQHQQLADNSSASNSSGSSRCTGQKGLSSLAKRGSSQDDNTASCSSSTSLDRSPTSSSRRRRSSTVSQCSSVLSEGTRQQLNFDLSPDLAPDSSLLEANAISPTAGELMMDDANLERPASPEPDSPDRMMSPLIVTGGGGGGSDRPISRMSTSGDGLSESLVRFSPDSTLGDSNDQEMAAPTEQLNGMARLTQCYDGAFIRPSSCAAAVSTNADDVEMASSQQSDDWQSEPIQDRGSSSRPDVDDDQSRAVEQLIDNVSGVLVSEASISENKSNQRRQTDEAAKRRPASLEQGQQFERQQQGAKRQHYSSAANSTCSSSFISVSPAGSSAPAKSAFGTIANKRSNTLNAKADELRLRTLVELERKDLIRASRSSSCPVASLPGKRQPVRGDQTMENPTKRAHINCYCHKPR